MNQADKVLPIPIGFSLNKSVTVYLMWSQLLEWLTTMTLPLLLLV
jgi:hypothetical protein